ncbi:MAG: energy-coupling factor transporter transmembrane component T [Methanomassiliicoccales archaeon]|jgi:energy-coupling factor transport system permease protein
MKLYAYRYLDTPIHRLHPSAIATWALGCTILSIVLFDPLMLLVLLLSSIPAVFIARVQQNWYTFIKIGLLAGLLVIIFTMIFSRTGYTVLFSLPFSIPTMGRVYFTLEAIYYGLAMLMRILALLTVFAVLTYAVCPDDLLDLFMKTKLPARSAFTTSLATTYIPTLMKDMDDIQVSLSSRGYAFNESRKLNYLKRKAAIVMPLLANSLERSIGKAEAMESRAFGSMKGRTQFFDCPLTGMDRIVLLCALLPSLLSMAFLFLGIGPFDYYPRMGPIIMDADYCIELSAIALSVLAVALVSPIKRWVDVK